MRTPSRLIAAAAATLYAIALVADPATIYKSVDEYGNTRFSDTPPGDGSATEIIQVNSAEPLSDAQYRARLDDMRQTTDRLVAARQERERLRAELRQAAVDEAASTPTMEPAAAEDWRDDGSYYPYPVYAPYPRARNQPHYGRPHYRPYLSPPWRQPGGRIIPGNNTQLMRPILPRD